MPASDASASGTSVSRPRPAFFVVLVTSALFVAGLYAASDLRERRARALEAATTAWVDPLHASPLRVPEWADPRWLERVGQVLADTPPFALEASAAVRSEQILAGLRAALGGLSFVKRVERLSATPGAGLTVELVLRAPVACIEVRGEYALVDEDGVVLEGRWPLPPRRGRAFLPVLGPLDDPLLARARAGDWLVEAEHKDALEIALSMAEHLSEDERAELGRVLIDARCARCASVTEPGARLELEGGRLALFGRPPATPEPGELAAADKWRALTEALALYEADPVANDWGLVDLRWDRPELALRNVAAPTVASAAPAHGGNRARSERARDESGPRVR